ncbi:hypothetical protein WDU94_002000 [Cyamophila willieti]
MLWTDLKRELRCAAYKTLHSWLTLAGYASNIELVAEELIDYLLADIVYEKQGVTLTTVMKKTRKRHQTKVGLESVDNKSMQQRSLPVSGGTKHYQTGDRLCAAAHRILADVLGCAASLLKPELIQNIQTTLAGLLLSLSTGCRDVYPYSGFSTSRLALYATLEACLLYSNPRSPDLAHYASVFYHAGLTDADVEIRKLCQRGIEILEKIQHPKADSLNFVLENLEEEKLKLLGPYVGKVNLVTEQMNGHDQESEEEMSEPLKKKGKQMETASTSGKRNKEQSGNKQGKIDNKQEKQGGKDNVDGQRNEGKKRKRKEEEEDSENNVEENDESLERKKKKIKQNSKGDNKKSGKDVDDLKNSGKSSKKKGEMSKALAKLANKPANFISLDGFSDSDGSSDDSYDDIDDIDSDESEQNVAMMLMNAMMGGNNSDFSFDDDDDDDDEEDDDGEEDDSSIFEDDSDSEMEASSEDDRPGVIITEIMDEEDVTDIGSDKERFIENSKQKDGKHRENITGKSRSASESSEVNAGKVNKSKNRKESETLNEASKKDAKTKQDVKQKGEATKTDGVSSSTKPVKGKPDSTNVTDTNEDNRKHGKEDVERKNEGKPKTDNIDCIDLGESDDSGDNLEDKTGNANVEKTDGNKGKTVSDKIESEEIILSSDNSQDSVMPLQKTE